MRELHAGLLHDCFGRCLHERAAQRLFPLVHIPKARSCAAEHVRDFGPIVHACTSSTNALGNRRVHSALSAYLNEDRPTDNTLVRDNKSYKCRWLKSDAAFSWACLKHGTYIQLAAAALKLSGNDKASRRVRAGLACMHCTGDLLLLLLLVCAGATCMLDSRRKQHALCILLNHLDGSRKRFCAAAQGWVGHVEGAGQLQV